MSHLLIVQSSKREPANQFFARALSLFSTLFKLRPCSSVPSDTLSVAVFPRTKARSSDIVWAKTTSRWLCGTGTWFYQGISGEEGLRKLLDHPRFLTDPDACLHDLDGQFVVASGDRESGELAVITDRLGILHIYAVQIGDTQVVSTSSIVLAALTRSEWDPEGCRQFLGSGNIYEPTRTLFKGVNKLSDACIYRFTDGGLRLQQRYWSIESVLRRGAETKVDVDQVAIALRESLCTVYRNFPKPLLDFTGGLDTRGLVGAMLRANLNLDVVVNGYDDNHDVRASTQIAQELGLRHHRRFTGCRSTQHWWDLSKMSLAYCDGECDLLYYGPTLEGHLVNSDGFDASLNGAIGEILKGHWWELLFPHTGRQRHFDCRLLAARRFTFEGEVPGLLAFNYPASLTDHYTEIIRQTISGLEDFPNTVSMDAVYLVLRQQKWLGRAVSATDHVWPCISPYGFKRPLELAILAPISARVHHRMSRRLIEHENSQLARFPLLGSSPASPLRFTTMHQFGPVLLHYSRLVARRFLIQAKFRGRDRHVKALYPHATLPLNRLVGLEEIRSLLDPCQMNTRELYNTDVLQVELKKCLVDTSTNAYRLGRILTLELLGRTVRNGKSILSSIRN